MTLDRGMNNLWPTPVLVDTIGNTDLTNRFCSYLFEHVDLSAPASEWMDKSVLDVDHPTVVQFREQIVFPKFMTYLSSIGASEITRNQTWVRAWLTGCRRGYMIQPHNHSSAVVSAVFYLMCDEEQAKGKEIYFVDPRANANRGYGTEFAHMFKTQQLTPTTGDVVMFPSFLYHYTIPFSGNMRLAMPVDLFITERRDD